METINKNEDVLSLSLAITNHTNHVERKMKRRRINETHPVIKSAENWEAKIFRLLEERHKMLNIALQGKRVVEEGSGLHLIHLLLVAATLIKEHNISSAADTVTELYRYVSVTGDSGQRVAAYFTDGLTARLLTQKSAFYNMVMSKPTAAEEFMAFTHLYRVSPFYQFAQFTANQAILEAFEREEENNNWVLHVIDFDISYGFQWPSLMQSLSEKATASDRLISLRITGLAKSLEELIDTENRLVSFSKGFQNINFEFHGLLRGSNLINLEKRKNETVAVNLVFHLSSLSDILKISETVSSIKLLNPSIVVLVEREGSQNSCGILSSYVDSLHYYAAMFDSLDDRLPLDSTERLSIEKNHLGREIKDLIASEEMKCSRFEMMETWKERMVSHGFFGIELSSKVSIQAKLLLKMGCHYHPHFEGESGGAGFRVCERHEGRGISLGWQDRFLITASAWRCSI
ncbi:hypothetical protein BVRB_1g000760 [Beta vulgaris subsp. vulgaris]|nr:hypothetical protein BVRB_1g000760 [Beta vulgaris subsp. vulgaris]